jgi:hypothetical protein
LLRAGPAAQGIVLLSPLPSTYPFSAQARLGGVLGYLRDAPNGAERWSRVLLHNWTQCPEEIELIELRRVGEKHRVIR